MNINRDNYEMFFLLYVDKELSKEELAAVNLFVKENPDLKPELDALLAATLPVENIGFDAKHALQRGDENLIKQENLLLLLDEELPAGTTKTLLAAIDADPLLKKEWNILRQTKLNGNESMVFPRKELLYKKDGGKTISMYFWRAAVAAAILGAGIFISLQVLKNKAKQDVAHNTEIKMPAEKLPGNLKPLQEASGDKQPGHQTTNVRQNLATAIPPTNKPGVKKEVMMPKQVLQQKNEELVKKETNHLPTPYYEQQRPGVKNDGVTNKNQEALAARELTAPKEQEKLNTNIQRDEDVTAVAFAKNNEDAPNFARNTVMDVSSKNAGNDHILFMKESKLNRSKISGLFRKVKRVIERNADISGSNPIKIAGFEIAAK